jgi:hypothetical protein
MFEKLKVIIFRLSEARNFFVDFTGIYITILLVISIHYSTFVLGLHLPIRRPLLLRRHPLHWYSQFPGLAAVLAGVQLPQGLTPEPPNTLHTLSESYGRQERGVSEVEDGCVFWGL